MTIMLAPPVGAGSTFASCVTRVTCVRSESRGATVPWILQRTGSPDSRNGRLRRCGSEGDVAQGNLLAVGDSDAQIGGSLNVGRRPSFVGQRLQAKARARLFDQIASKGVECHGIRRHVDRL